MLESIVVRLFWFLKLKGEMYFTPFQNKSLVAFDSNTLDFHEMDVFYIFEE